MSPDVIAILIAQIPVIIGLFVLWAKSGVNAHDIKNAAAKVEVDKMAVDTGQTAYILQRVTELNTALHEMQLQYNASMVRELNTAKEKNDSVVLLQSVQNQLDTALAELKKANNQIELLNQQITALRRELIVAKGVPTDAQDAEHASSVAADASSAGAIQEVPPLPTTPGPIAAVDDETGEVLKAA